MADDNELLYEQISEIRRVEIDSSLISPIRPDFYKAANALIKKNADARNKILIENPDMYDGVGRRYRHIASMLEDIIKLRTNKVWGCALRDASSGEPKAQENLTEEEKRLYDTVFNIAKGQFALISEGKKAFVPDIEHAHEKPEPPKEEIAEEKQEPIVPTPAETPEVAVQPENVEGTEASGEEKTAEKVPEKVIVPDDPEKVFEPPTEELVVDTMIPDEEVVVRVLCDVPTFSGPERDYTLKKEDVVRLPSIMASALINRKMAILVRTTA